MTEVEIGPCTFVSFDNWHIKVRQVRGSRTEIIYFGPSDLAAFERYIAELKAQQQATMR